MTAVTTGLPLVFFQKTQRPSTVCVYQCQQEHLDCGITGDDTDWHWKLSEYNTSKMNNAKHRIRHDQRLKEDTFVLRDKMNGKVGFHTWFPI